MVLGLLTVTALAHAGSLAPTRAFYSRDLYAFWHPAVDSFVRAIGEGAWPVWNPYFGFGEPMAANPNFQIAYPPTWLNLVLPAPLYFKLFVVAHGVGGAVGVSLLARRLRAAPLGAFAAGAAWATFPPLLSAIGMYHHFSAAAWIPWVLLALEGALARPGARGAIALGAAAGGQALAGSADMCFMSALLAAGWTAYHVAARRVPSRAWPAVGAAMAGAAFFAAALAAVQWLPALALVPGTARAAPSAATSLYWSLHPLSLLDLVVPRLTAGAAATTAMGTAARARLFESREPLLATIYLGAPALLAALAALLARRHRRIALLLAMAWGAFVLAALGRHTPLLPALLRMPGVAVFRFPPKYLLPAGLPWALLVGLGVDALCRARGRPRWTLHIGLAGTLLAAALAAAAAAGPLTLALARALAEPLPAAGLLPHVRGRLLEAAAVVLAGSMPFLLAARRLPARAAAVALALLGGLTLVRENHAANPGAPLELARYRPPLVARIAGTGAPRIFAFPHPKDWLTTEYVRRPAGWPPSAGWVLGTLDRLAPAVGARWGLRGSYDGDLTGLSPAMTGRLSTRVRELSAGGDGVRWLQLGGVDYVVALEESVFGGALLSDGQQASVYRLPVRLLRTPDPLPKAFLAAEALAVADDEQALSMLEDPALDPRRTVVLAAGTAAPAATGASPGLPAAEVRTLWRRADAAAFEVRTATPAHLVMLEAFDPSWRAAVDGAEAPLLRANLLFRAVPVPAGVHRVELRCRPRALPWGAALSAAAAALGLALFKGVPLR